MAHAHLDPDQAGRDRVRVALEGDESRRPDGVVFLDRRRVAGSRQGPQPLELREVPHTRTLASASSQERVGGLLADELLQLGNGAGPPITDAFAEAVELALGVVDPRRRHGAPEALGGEMMDFSTLPLRFPRRGGQATTLAP